MTLEHYLHTSIVHSFPQELFIVFSFVSLEANLNKSDLPWALWYNEMETILTLWLINFRISVQT